MKAETSKKQIIAAAEREKEGEYWKNKLSGEWEKSYFPYDYDNEKNNKSEGGPGADTAVFKFTGEIYTRLKQITKGSEYTLNIVLQAGLIALLEKYTGSTDIVVGTVVYKQEKKGQYINTVLALRNRLHHKLTFKELLYRVRQTLVEANENQNYPIGVLVDRLNMSAPRGRDFPLFDVAILLENIHDKSCLQPITHNMTFSFKQENETLQGNVEYTASKYNRTTIERIIGHYTRLLSQAVKKVEAPISLINILSEEETRRLLTEFNDTAAAYPRHSTIHHLFAEQRETNPDHIAVVGKVHGQQADYIQLTYKELNEKSNGLARLLRQKGVREDNIVAIMPERSLEMIIGILGILKAGGAYLPIESNYPQERIDYMLKDSASKTLLTSLEIANSINNYQLTINNLQLKGNSLAYVLYTSGTTGRPKSVMIEHRSVIRLVKNTNYVKFENRDRILQTGALAFDASTFEIWGALLNALTLFLVSKKTILESKQLKKTIEKYEISIMWLTSPLFNRVVDSDIEVFAGLHQLLVGGDVLSPSHIDRLKSRFPGLKVIDGYGPTENTTFSTTYLIDREYKGKIPIGKPVSNSTAYIVNKINQLVPLGVVGELLVGGDGVARGYLNKPELTAEKFDHDLWDLQDYQDEKQKVPGKRIYHRSYRSYKSYIFYRTGDLTRWLPDGNIEFLGRIDRQVKIRGFRIEIGEIESQLQKHKEVKDAIVTARQDENGDKYLCAYIISGNDLTPREMKEYLSRKLPGYMVPAYFIRLEKIPLTPNGKVDWKAMEAYEAKLDTGSRYEAPRDELEKTIAAIWQEVLKVEKVGIHDNFFELGGDSFKAMTLARKFSDWRGKRVSIVLIFENPTIAALAPNFAGGSPGKKQGITIKPGEKKDRYPLASAQQRYYIMDQLSGAGMSYHIPTAVQMNGRLEKEKLETIMMQLVRRHESLRTSFENLGEEILQFIHNRVEFKLEKYTAAGGEQELEEITKKFMRPFDLARAPLFRAGLITREPGTHILMIDMHHLITDGVSARVFIEEFTALYADRDLPAARITYKDYARWQEQLTRSGELKKQEDYWLECFKGEIPRLNMPVDFPGTGENQYEGSTIRVEMGPRLVNGIKRLIKETAASLNIVLMAAYAVLLSKYTGQEEIIIGTLTTGRNHEEIQNIIGLFTNSLAIRNFPGEDKIFEIYLNEVKKNMLQAYENQDYQFNDLVWKLGDRVDTRGTPLYSTIITIQDIEIPPVEIPGLELTPYPLGKETSKFPFYIDVYHDEENIRLAMKYSTALYKSSTAERIVSDYIQVLDQVVKKREIRIKDIKISMNSEEIETNIFKDESGEFNF